MAKTFADIKVGDRLYVVYYNLNNDYQIGEAIVNDFIDWTYEYGDRYEAWGSKPQRNIVYYLDDVKFSRNLEYSLDKTHFVDSVVYGCDYKKVMMCACVETFTDYNEAKEYIIDHLELYIDQQYKEIEEIEKTIEKYNNNLKEFK